MVNCQRGLSKTRRRRGGRGRILQKDSASLDGNFSLVVHAASASDGVARSPTITLEPTHPFAFDATFHKPDHFPSQDTAWEPGVRWQTMRFRGRVLGLRIEEAPAEVRVGVWAERPVPRTLLAPLSSEVAWRANLRLDLGDFERRARRDGQLAPAVRRWRGMRPMHMGSLYEYLVIAIVLQNATVRRSVQMLQALFERYGSLVRFDDRELCAFWDAIVRASRQDADIVC